jgi:hypothetical protein
MPADGKPTLSKGAPRKLAHLHADLIPFHIGSLAIINPQP